MNADTFWTRVQEHPNGCWEWTSTSRYGYGRVRFNERNTMAHRVAYELVVGLIPTGYELDHLCRNRSCVNPAHLEPVPHRENCRRGTKAMQTHCVNGHAFTPANTYRRRDNGCRRCRACDNARHRRVSWHEGDDQ